MEIESIVADYANEQHGIDIMMLIQSYALDSMGGGKALSAYTCDNLINALSKRNDAISILSYVDGKPAGLMNCFEGFSTFKCKPLINIHDVVVLHDYRGLGLCQRMLELIEKIALDKGCCKLTLEVLEGNDAAKNAYLKYGFKAYELDPANGKALFWQKSF